MIWTLAIAAPLLVAGEITETTIELRALDIPQAMDVVMFRPIDADLTDSLRTPTADQPYLGYGALATLGTSRTDTVWVTSPADEGPGTLRFHLETSPVSDAVVAFDPDAFAGEAVIELTRAIRVRATRAIVDGLTARTAVTVAQQDHLDSAVFVFDGAEAPPQGSFDTVFRGLRIFQGGEGAVDVNHTADGIHFTGTANKVVIDHCEFGPARDEAIGFAGSQQWITVQWCTFHDVLKTFLVGADWSRTSVHHNFFYRNGERLLLVQGFPTHPGMLEYRNNVVFDWRTRGMQFREAAGGNMIGNAYLAGSNTTSRVARAALEFDVLVGGVDVHDLVYAADNIFPATETDVAGRVSPWPIDPHVSLAEHPSVSTPTTSAETAIVEVLSEAGLGPYRSEDDRTAARIAFVGTKIDSVLEWIPRDVARDVAHVGPNRRVVFDCRAQGGHDFSEHSAPLEVWSLAARPPAPCVSLEAPGRVRVTLTPGENPGGTGLALSVGSVEVGWTWLTPRGGRSAVPVFATAVEWNESDALHLSRRERTLRVVARNGAGVVTESVETTVPAGLAGPTRLLPSFPNPARTRTHLPFVLAAPGDVRIEIFDPAGRHVRMLSAESMPAGYGALGWDGRTATGARVASGVYLYRLTAGDVTATGRLVRVE